QAIEDATSGRTYLSALSLAVRAGAARRCVRRRRADPRRCRIPARPASGRLRRKALYDRVVTPRTGRQKDAAMKIMKALPGRFDHGGKARILFGEQGYAALSSGGIAGLTGGRSAIVIRCDDLNRPPAEQHAMG